VPGDLEVAVEVRQCPLRPGSRSAHWDLALAVEVRLCPLWDLDCEEEEAEEMEEEDAEAEEEENSSDKI